MRVATSPVSSSRSLAVSPRSMSLCASSSWPSFFFFRRSTSRARPNSVATSPASSPSKGTPYIEAMSHVRSTCRSDVYAASSPMEIAAAGKPTGAARPSVSRARISPVPAPMEAMDPAAAARRATLVMCFRARWSGSRPG